MEWCGGGALVGPRREGPLEGLAERRIYPIAAGAGRAGPGALTTPAWTSWNTTLPPPRAPEPHPKPGVPNEGPSRAAGSRHRAG